MSNSICGVVRAARTDLLYCTEHVCPRDPSGLTQYSISPNEAGIYKMKHVASEITIVVLK